jgi:RNA polymerase sigma-70 factor (ECF subfamily)
VIQHRESHYRLAYSFLKNQEDALDVVQESIYKALASKNTLKTPEHIKTWYYRIVVNTAIDMLRKQKKSIPMEDEVLLCLEQGKNDYYQDLDLIHALETLPVKYRSVVMLKYFEDLTLDEISEVLNLNVSTVKTQLYKALEILRIQMTDPVEEGGVS